MNFRYFKIKLYFYKNAQIKILKGSQTSNQFRKRQNKTSLKEGKNHYKRYLSFIVGSM